MSTCAGHLFFASKRDYPFRCDPRLFSEEEYALVSRWGYWNEALASGVLRPISAGRSAFLEAGRGGLPPTETRAEAWWRYTHRLAIKAAHADAILRAVEDEEQGFYPRAMVKQHMGIMSDTVSKEHKR